MFCSHVFISSLVNHSFPCPLPFFCYVIYPERSIVSVQTRFRLASVPPGLGQCGTLKPGLILFTAWLYSNEPDLRDTLQPDVLWWCHYPLLCPIQLGGFSWVSILTVSVHARRKIVSSFTHPHVDPKHYERCFDECPCWSCRAGLVIGHSGHFPGGPTHLKGRQNFFFFFLPRTITQGQRAASGPLVCLLYWQRKSPNHNAL